MNELKLNRFYTKSRQNCPIFFPNADHVNAHALITKLLFQRCSPPDLVLSLSPGLGPDGLPSPGGYFPQYPTNGSGNNTAVAISAVGNTSGLGNAAGSLASAMSGGGPSGSCSGNSNNPSPLLSGHNTVMGAQNSHRSSPCNELLAAMRSSATNGESSQILDFSLDRLILFKNKHSKLGKNLISLQNSASQD